MPPHKSPGPTLNLEWASQKLQPNGPARFSRITVQPLQSPHLSHKLSLPSPANILLPTEYLKDQKLLLIGQCGSKYICMRVIDSLYHSTTSVGQVKENHSHHSKDSNAFHEAQKIKDHMLKLQGKSFKATNFNCRNVQFFQCAILGNNRKHTKLLTDPYLTALEMLDILKDRTLICKALAIGQHKNDTLTSIFSSE
ncbi:hypothetical protein LguiA_033799 [Lonicera macranthoides]